MLTALLLTLAALPLLALAAVPLARAAGGAALVHGGSLAASVVFAAIALAALAGGAAGEARLAATPFGAMRLALDGLSAWFLLILGLVGSCSALSALGHARGAPARLLAPYPLFLAGMALTLLAADGLTLLLGLEAMSLASWALVAADHARPGNREAARLYLVFAALAAACLVPALGLLAGPGGDLAFAAMRERPPQGATAALVLALVVAGAGAKAGLVPLHVWLPLAHPAAPSHVSALMSAAMTKVALYLAARLLLDIAGPAQPLWWGLPLVALGAASAVLGALRANLEAEGKTLLACSTIENLGLIAIGLGLAACFRAADLGPLAALAAGAALLHALNHALFKTLLFLGMGEVAHAAASPHLDRLGGLIRPMPLTAACVLVGAGAAASLPPLPGFASEWLLLQALLAAWRVGDLGFQLLLLAAAALAALAAALAAAAMVRFFGLVFLGRPRTPRAAGAGEAAAAPRAALLLAAGLTLLFGLIPGPLLGLAEGAQRLLVRHAMQDRAGLLAIGVGDGASSYAPLGLALLLGLAGLALWRAVKRPARAEPRRGPAWDGGLRAPPPHLPFGDPLTQPSAAGFGQPLRRMLGAPLLAARESVVMPAPGETAPARIEAGFRDPSWPLLLAPLAAAREAVVARIERQRDLSIRHCLVLPFATLVGLLLLVAWLEGGAVTLPGAILAQLLHLALVLAAAPLLVGAIRWLKARMLGRCGPHPLQPWRDILKLLRKRPLLAENASWISRAAPYAGAAAALAALALVPSLARGMLLAPLGDLLLVAGLVALGRVAQALAGLDAGTAFGGLGAAREMSFAALAEPALLLAVLILGMLAGSTAIETIAAAFQEGGVGLRVSLALALIALLAVAVAENARIPVDNPATHLELTMVHEAMLLEASGRHLALWEAAAALRLTLWFALIAALFLPYGTAPPGFAPLLWLGGALAWAAKMAALAAALAAFESAIAKMRVFRVPEFLGVAVLLGLLGAILLFVSARVA